MVGLPVPNIDDERQLCRQEKCVFQQPAMHAFCGSTCQATRVLRALGRRWTDLQCAQLESNKRRQTSRQWAIVREIFLRIKSTLFTRIKLTLSTKRYKKCMFKYHVRDDARRAISDSVGVARHATPRRAVIIIPLQVRVRALVRVPYCTFPIYPMCVN